MHSCRESLASGLPPPHCILHPQLGQVALCLNLLLGQREHFVVFLAPPQKKHLCTLSWSLQPHILVPGSKLPQTEWDLLLR